MHKYFLVIAQNKWFVNRLWNWNFNPVFDNVHKKLVPAHYTVTSNVLTVTDENHRRCIFPILPANFSQSKSYFLQKVQTYQPNCWFTLIMIRYLQVLHYNFCVAVFTRNPSLGTVLIHVFVYSLGFNQLPTLCTRNWLEFALWHMSLKIGLYCNSATRSIKAVVYH